MSITEAAEVASIETVDYIFHFASPASPPKYQKLGLETIKVNTVGTENLIELALTHSARLIYASTSEVYGDPLVSPQPESYWGNVNPIGPRSVYDEAKRLGETLIALYCREKKLDAGIVRIFNTYGPKMDPNDGRVVSNFIVQALQNHDITVYGEGQQTRSFQYVDDLVEGMIRMMASPDQFLGPVNMGNPNEFTILELAEKVIELTGSSSKIIYKPLPSDDPMMRQPDISIAKKELEWSPKIELEEGLIKTIDFFKSVI
jgi:UDP-glucuronate decarboxylase